MVTALVPVSTHAWDPDDVHARWISAISNDNTATLNAILTQTIEARVTSDQATVSEPLWGVTASNGKSALMVASKVGDESLANQLVGLGADIKAKTQTDGTAFMFAILGDQQPLALWLMEQGADIDARGSNGWTSVMIASAKGLDDTLDWLLTLGANANTPDVYGFSPLMRAADNAHSVAVSLLLSDAEVDVNWQDELDNSALHYAVSGAVSSRASSIAMGVYMDIIQQLLQADASPTLPNRRELSPIDIAQASLNDPGISQQQLKQRDTLIRLLEGSIRTID